jgi:hypothetical protein
MTKEFKKKEFWTIEYNDFDKLIEEKLGLKYESVAANEWNNYSSYKAMNILKTDADKDFFHRYNLPKIKEALNSGDGNKVDYHSLLVFMVGTELLLEGNYLIEVYW